MKKLLYLIIALSILSTACKKEDDETIAPATTTTIVTTPTLSLDNSLIGIWSNLFYSTDAYLTFGSNGMYTVSGNTGAGFTDTDQGEWWAVDNFINSYPNMFPNYHPLGYYITNDTLRLTKTDGSYYKEYIRQ